MLNLIMRSRLHTNNYNFVLGHNFTIVEDTRYLQLVYKANNEAIAIFRDNTASINVLLFWAMNDYTATTFTQMHYYSTGVYPSSAYCYSSGSTYHIYILGLASGSYYLRRVSISYLFLSVCHLTAQ